MDKRDDSTAHRLVTCLAHGGNGLLLDLSDYYRCPAGCGTFEHERRTHRVRLIDAGYTRACGARR
jgi:hypothetical protein